MCKSWIGLRILWRTLSGRGCRASRRLIWLQWLCSRLRGRSRARKVSHINLSKEAKVEVNGKSLAKRLQQWPHDAKPSRSYRTFDLFPAMAWRETLSPSARSQRQLSDIQHRPRRRTGGRAAGRLQRHRERRGVAFEQRRRQFAARPEGRALGGNQPQREETWIGWAPQG